MITNRLARYSLALAAVALLGASPAAAQGKGHGREKAKDRQEQPRPELRRRTPQAQKQIQKEQQRLREETLRRDSGIRGSKKTSAGNSGKVPPGWCVEGNPHNTIENCGYSASRSRSREDYGRYDSYNGSHDDFHRYLDRKYSELAAQSPLDLSRRLRLRAEKQREHDAWHDRNRE
jgi:hypothetical protein